MRKFYRERYKHIRLKDTLNDPYLQDWGLNESLSATWSGVVTSTRAAGNPGGRSVVAVTGLSGDVLR